jgi:phage-related minor tail protein
MELGKLLVTIGANTRDLDKQLGAAVGKFKSFGRNMKRLGGTLSASITAPLAAIGGVSFKTAMNFGAAMAKVQAVSGATAGEFKRLEENAKMLGRTTVFTATDVANLQTEYAKLGFSAAEIENVTGATLALAQATDSDLAQAAEVAGSTLRAFGLDSSETARLTDVMAQSFSASALDMDTFSDAMKYAAPVAKAAGVSVEETTAMLGTLANAGIKGSQAGTALRRILVEMGSAGGNTADAIAKLAAEGITMEQAMDEVGRNAQSALLVLAEGSGTTTTLTETLANAGGAAQAMADIMNDTSAGAMARMQSAMEGAQIALGEALAPTIEKVMGYVERLANWFTGLSESTRGTMVMVAGVVGAIGPLLIILPQLMAVATTVGPALAGAFTAMTGPIGIAIAAIAGIALAINYFWDDVRVPLTKVVNFFIELYNQNVGLRIAVAYVKTTFVGNFKIIGMVLKQTWEAITSIGTALWKVVTGDFSGAWESLKTGFTNIGQGIADTAAEVGADLMAALADAVTKEPVELITPETLDRARDRILSLLDFGGGGAAATMPPPEVVPAVVETATAKPVDTRELVTGPPALDMIMGEPSKWNTFRDNLANSTEGLEAMAQAATGMGNQLGHAFAQVITGADGAADAMRGAVSAIVDQAFNAATASIIQAATQTGAASGPAAAIVIPGLITAGTAMLRGLFANLTGFADGGIVYGPTMGLVGEYAGARSNPEVIAPLNKLQSIIGGGQNVTVTGRISGRDILLSNDRAGRDRFRQRGY